MGEIGCSKFREVNEQQIKHMTKQDIRIINERPIYFYSLSDIERIIPPEQRLREQKSETLSIHNSPNSAYNGMKEARMNGHNVSAPLHII